MIKARLGYGFLSGENMNKRKFAIFLIILCVATVAIGLIGCTHRHRFSSDWSSNASYHWHSAKCKHSGEMKDYASHSFGIWSVVKAPVGTNDGEEKRVCGVCGYSESRKSHAFSNDWSNDSVYHWKEAVCEHKNETGYRDKHSFGEWNVIKDATETENGERERNCVVCGYTDTEITDKLPHTHAYSDEWAYDGRYHWKEAVCGHDEIKDRELHDTDGLGKCRICENIIGTEGLLYEENGEGYTVIGLKDGVLDETIIIPPVYNGKKVTEIGDVAFQNLSSIKRVVIGEGIVKIGQGAFFSCRGITEVVLQEGLKSIGQLAFYNCSNLVAIKIPDSVTSIESEVFERCDALRYMVIGREMMNIGFRVFKGCDALSEIYYRGREEDWKKININDNNDVLTDTNLYYYSETQPTAEGNYWRYGSDGVTIVKW